LREVADEAFDRLGGSLFNDPWAARDRYIEVVVGAAKIDDLIAEEAAGPISEESAATMHRLLDLQRNAMSMFTSCGWFFNDVAGIETVQVMRYAARTVDLLEELGQPTSEDRLVAVLERAESNDPTKGTAADLYLKIASSPKTPPTTFTDA
jgi:alpha-amylase/alpha-mannosidase (GH57 family)